MKIAFRTDASVTIGQGHVRRCLTLASALREQGAETLFICREHDGHLCHLIKERGFAVSRLPAYRGAARTNDASAHGSWLGSSWQEDAEQTLAAIGAGWGRPDWVVVDHYAIDQRWESVLRTSAERIMVIDDLADRHHNCELLLDQNLVEKMDTRYADKVPAACKCLLGPKYALLEPIYAELHDRIPLRAKSIRRIFIFFGGMDSDNLTGRTLAAFLGLNRPDIEIDVVINPGAPHAETIRQQVMGHANIHLHIGLPTLAPLMLQADLSIGGGGATTWERICLGLPTLVVTVAQHQTDVARELHSQGLIRCLGEAQSISGEGLRRELLTIIDAGCSWIRLYDNGDIVDGRGVNRVCEAIHSHSLRGSLCS